MTPVALVGLAIGAGLLVVALRSHRMLAWAIGLAGLVIVAIVAVRLEVATIPLGRTSMDVTSYGRSLIATIAVTGAFLGLVAAAASAPATVAAALLAAIAGVAVAVVVPDPIVGSWAVLAGAVAAIGIGLVAEGSIDRPAPSVNALRAVGAAGAVGVVGIAVAAPPLVSPAPDAGIVGLAYLAVALALGIRLAAVPAHGWAARLADTTPAPLHAATLVWLPVALALVAIAWQAGPVAATGVDLGPERLAVVAFGAATVLLATAAALAQDDLGHVTAYLAIADGGLALIAFGAADAAAWGPAQTWLLVLAATKTGLVAWAASIEAAYGTRHAPDLEGWARHSPVLGAAFAVVAVATVGWPGSAALSARLDLVRLALPGPVGIVLALALLVVALPYVRVLLIGLRPPQAAVAASPGGLPRRPAGWEVAEVAPARERAAAAGRDARALWSLNRRPTAAGAVVAVALLALAVSAGALGTGPAENPEMPGASPSAEASSSAEASPSAEASSPGSASPSEGASPPASTSPSVGASPSASGSASPSP